MNFTKAFARSQALIPLSTDSTCIELAAPQSRPFSASCVEVLKTLSRKDVLVRYLDDNEWESHEFWKSGPDAYFVDEVAGRPDDEFELERLAQEAPIVALFDELVREGIAASASDIHLEAEKTHLAVRFRIDGALCKMRNLPRSCRAGLVSRIKILAQLNILETRLAQDGRFSVQTATGSVDLRVSTLPGSNGESIVIRILRNAGQQWTIDDLSMPPSLVSRLGLTLRRPQGLVIVCGPTGSGKSTSLHAMVRSIWSEEKKIISIEDPIERQFEGILQIAVREDIGLSFASLLKRVLRHDPDVILLGEIRDEETAQLALRASQTGHLVLSTLHTPDAKSAMYRLADLGIRYPHMAQTLELVLAQRLLRRLCVPCGGAGCAECRFTGFRGRLGVWEAIFVGPATRQCLNRGDSLFELQDCIRIDNPDWKDLRSAGEELVGRGLTTLGELGREI